VKQFEQTKIRDLSNRTFIVTLKEPKQEVISEISNKKARSYKKNIEQYNQALKRAFQDNWEFGKKVKFVTQSRLDRYKGDSKYAILNSAPYIHNDLAYWVFVVDEEKSVKPRQMGYGSFDPFDYHFSFPIIRAFDEKDNMAKSIPFDLVSFDGSEESHYEGVYSTRVDYALDEVFNKRAVGYAKSDIMLMVQLMHNHLQAMHEEGFEGDYRDYINQAHEENCRDLRNQTIAINPGIEVNFFSLEMTMNFNNKKEMAEAYKKRCSNGHFDDYPYDVKMHRPDDVAQSLRQDKSDYNVMVWYPYELNKKARIVINEEG
jgi:very-short-patch-repair endonuclease